MQQSPKRKILMMPDPRWRRVKWIAIEALYAATVLYLLAGALFDFPAPPTRGTLSVGIAALTVGIILQIVNRKGSMLCRVPMAVLLVTHALALILLFLALR